MASNSLGTLTLDLIAKIGGFTSGLDQAERASKKSADEIQKNIESIGVTSYAVGNTLGQYLKQGIDAIAGAFPALIENAAKFQDIADKTGGSAQGFAAFATSAAVADVGIQSIADASTKLSKNLIGVSDDSKAAGAGLQALGLNISDIQKLKPDEQIKAIANAFGNFADGAGKAAVAQQLFGKSGAELVKFFKDYTENGGDVTILTDQMIAQADDFSDAQKRARTEFGLYASALATQALPAITAFTTAVTDTIKQVAGLGDQTDALGRNQGVAIFAEGAINKLAFVVDAAQGVAVVFSRLGEFIGASAAAAEAKLKGDAAGLAAIRSAYNDSLDASQFHSVQDAYKKALADQKEFAKQKAINDAAAPSKPALVPTLPSRAKGGGGKDDPTKKLLDNDLAAFRAQGEQAKELLAERNKILDLYNSQGLLSVKDYYAALQGNLDEATKAQAKSYDDQIDALKKFQTQASKQTDVADAQGKINKLEEDKAKLYRASGTASLESSIKQVQAQKAISDAFNEVNAKILEFNGNLRAAAEIRFDASNEKLLKQAIAEGNDETVKRIGLLKQYTLAQADITKATDAFSLAQGDLSIQEDRITIAQQRGTMSEIQALTASGDARKAAVAVMQQELDALLAINDAVRTPQQNQAIERLKLQLDQLKASVDPLGDKINGIFGDAAGSAFSDFITGAKTAKEALKDFANQVFKSFADMIAKDLGKQLFSSLFGGGSSNTDAGGIGGLLSGILGGSSKSSGASSGGGLSGLLGGLFGSGGGAAAASGGDPLGAFIALNGFASGGFTGAGAANDPAGVVHKGEYVLTAAQTQKIGVANLDRGNFGGGTVVQIHQTFAPGATRQTTDQAAMAAGNAARRATARNG